MVAYSITITRREGKALHSQAEFNRAMLWSMTSAGLLWIDKYLPLHFESGAAGRYGFQPRPIPYDQVKERITKKPALPLRFIADVAGHENDPDTLMGFVLGNRASGLIKVIPQAKGDVYTLRVPVAMPHPLNPKYASSTLGVGRGELVRKIKGEEKDMARVIMTGMRRDFRENVEITVTRIQG